MLEITRDLPKGRPISIYKHPIRIKPLYPFTGSFRDDRTRSTASDPPTVTAPTVKPYDRTRFSQRPDAPVLSDRTPSSQRPDAPIAQHRAPAK
jgi:hypothetical protein